MTDRQGRSLVLCAHLTEEPRSHTVHPQRPHLQPAHCDLLGGRVGLLLRRCCAPQPRQVPRHQALVLSADVFLKLSSFFDLILLHDANSPAGMFEFGNRGHGEQKGQHVSKGVRLQQPSSAVAARQQRSSLQGLRC